MIIETKKLSELKPAPYNPRKSNEKQEAHLKASLEKFGVVEPIIFNKQTGYIVGGHFRVRELKKLGYKEIDCVIVDLNEHDEKELNIRLNANTGEWDWDSLANEWEAEELTEWGLDVPEFGGVELSEEFGEDFTLKDGDKEPFQQMTFTLADEQAEQIKNAITDIKATEEYKYCETLGNENSNGNALYLIIMQWAEQRK
jgi:ParB-like chromosome segregation protein Spo0J